MELDFLLFVIVTIILFVVIGIKKSIANQFRNLEIKLNKLSEELRKAQSGQESGRSVQAKPGVAEGGAQESRIPRPTSVPTGLSSGAEPQVPPVTTMEKPFQPQETRRDVSESAKTASDLISPEKAFPDQGVVEKAFPDLSVPGQPASPGVRPPTTLRPPVARPPKPKKPGFFERNPDLEKFIGENLANKIGIGVLVLGIGFFVKYAIDQDWIGEIGRVFVGIVCSGILLGVAHRLRKTFSAFSSVLMGGGIAVLYLTIAIAFHEYKIFSQTEAFLLMLVITAFAVVLSLVYNRIELAVLSILGGFASPFMVSTGEGNYVVLFVYVLVLDVGMLVLAYYKKWNLVNIISYAFTILLFGGWLAAQYIDMDPRPVAGALIFATLFYLVFFAMNVVNNIKERTSFKAIEISILLSNTFCYYAAGMVILNAPGADMFKGLFTAALAIFNFIFAFTLYKSARVDKNLVFLLIGLVLTFVSLAAPVQLEGNYITLFWSAETVLLLWLSQKSGIRLMKLGSVVLMILMVFSLVMDWDQIYNGTVPPLMNIIFNKGYLTGLLSFASTVLTLWLLSRERNEDPLLIRAYTVAVAIGGGLILYVTHVLELQYQLSNRGFDYTTQNLIMGTFNVFFVLMILLAERRWIPQPKIKFAFAGWGLLAMLAYAFFYQPESIAARDAMITGEGTLVNGEAPSPATGFIFHYLLLAITIVVAVITLRKIRANAAFNEKTGNAYTWVFVIFFVFVASAELDHLLVVLLGTSPESIDHILTQNHKIGFPILWGIASFILIFMGLKRKQKHIRIVSLSLFLFTLLKLFIVDIRGISEGGKIAAFISLGVLLLVVSFMYQRLKKILLSDEAVAAVTKTEEPT